MSDWGGKPAFGLLPLSAHKQNKEIPSMAVLALFIETIDGIAYFAIAVRGFFQNLHKKLDKPQLITYCVKIYADTNKSLGGTETMTASMRLR